jgi:hypothetical protein
MEGRERAESGMEEAARSEGAGGINVNEASVNRQHKKKRN